MISIGGVYKGPELENSPFSRAHRAALRALKELRGPLTLGAPNVNAVFFVPGSLGDPDFDGLEYGDYSKKDKSIVVDIAVPRDAVVTEAESASFIVGGLRGANAMAFEYFRQKGEEFPLREAEAIVTSIAERLGVRERSASQRKE